MDRRDRAQLGGLLLWTIVSAGRHDHPFLPQRMPALSPGHVVTPVFPRFLIEHDSQQRKRQNPLMPVNRQLGTFFGTSRPVASTTSPPRPGRQELGRRRTVGCLPLLNSHLRTLPDSDSAVAARAVSKILGRVAGVACCDLPVPSQQSAGPIQRAQSPDIRLPARKDLCGLQRALRPRPPAQSLQPGLFPRCERPPRPRRIGFVRAPPARQFLI